MVESAIATIVALFSAFGISFVVEKSPIKINPLSMIKKFLVGDICDKIDDINEKVEKLEKKVDRNEIDRIKETILTYKKSCDIGMPLSEHDYEYILKLYDKYTKQGGNSFVSEIVGQIKEYYKNQKVLEKNIK